ncbi:MAG: hypothetical protein RLN90_12370 [Balneolaceae bacterium]
MLLTFGTAETVYAQGQRSPRGQNQIDVKEIVKEQKNWLINYKIKNYG